MESLWVGIDPHPTETRILAMAGPGEILLKARLRPHPQHPRAAAILLEALSLWQGATVRAALCADTEPPLFDTVPGSTRCYSGRARRSTRSRSCLAADGAAVTAWAWATWPSSRSW